MHRRFIWNNSVSMEVVFQVLLHAVLFIFYSFDHHNPGVKPFQIAFFLNYALAAFVINYLLLPRLYYKKKYLRFTLATLLTTTAAIVIEEFVLEKIYFPDTRGTRFMGIFYSLLDVMPVIIILSGFKFAWDATIKQQEVDQLRASVKESELQFLKSQINPHFLFNNLNNLYSHAMDNSPKTPSIILELSSLLRYMLYDCKEDLVPLQKEIEHLKNFSQLSELQIEDRGTVDFKAENIGTGHQIAPLILTVFVENAFKHSTASQSEGIEVRIHIEVTDNGVLRFECANSFHPMTNTEKLSQGIGLRNVQKRLRLIYPNAHRLSIEESDTLYLVKMDIELNKANL